VTNPDRLRRWFSPVTGELKLGGRFHVENNASGTITACEPQRKVEGTWEFGGGVSWITITLAPDADGARLELEHVAHIDPHWDQFGPGAVGVGWDLGFMGLARHLAEPNANLPQESEEGWHLKPEAKLFIRTASDGWGAAAIVAGEGREQALTAAESTRQFYTGDYALDATPLRDIDDWLDRFRGFWTHKLASLATEIARGKKQRPDP
jgi:hypothetical protein